jgi:hypothetical protein
MEIDINQNKISVRDKYQIFIDGQQRHNATSKLFRLFPEIELYEWDSELPRMRINKKFGFLAANYDLTKSDGKVYEFRTKSYWKGHFQCMYDADIYDIYAHRGRKYSVYKNDIQVAWWTKQAVSWFNGDNYKIIADRNCDYNLVISFCLIIDNYSSEGNKGTLNVNIGRIGPQVKKFNANWQPQY